jgi:hypothetical protein
MIIIFAALSLVALPLVKILRSIVRAKKERKRDDGEKKQYKKKKIEPKASPQLLGRGRRIKKPTKFFRP